MVHHGAFMVPSWCLGTMIMVHHGAFHGAFMVPVMVPARFIPVRINFGDLGFFPRAPKSLGPTKALTGSVGLGWLALCSPMVWQGWPRAVAGH